jgi:hypothetical protein
MENGASRYSNSWKPKKVAPILMVSKNPFKVEKRELQSMPKCAHVRHIPECIRRAVLKKGTPQGEGASIPKGGHTQPTQIVGDTL